jgi:hypothetical protein
MNVSTLMTFSFLGTGAVAIWVYFRFPRLRPKGLVVAVGHVGASFFAFGTTPFLVHEGAVAVAAPYSIAVNMGGVVIPFLTYVLLSWIWLIARIHDIASGGPSSGHLVRADRT